MLMWKIFQAKVKDAVGHFSQRSLTSLTTIAALSIFLTDVAEANVVGSDTQNFNPTTSGLDFVTVHSSETLRPGYLNLGLFLNHAVNTLPFFADSPQGRTEYSDAVLGADLNVGFGLMKHWDIGVSIPQILHQEVKGDDGFHGQFAANGNTEVRVNTKVRLWGEADYGIAVIGSANMNRIKNNPYVGKDGGTIYNLELAGDTTIGSVAVGANVGHRWRDAGTKVDPDNPIDPIGNQLIASAAMSYLFSSLDTKLIAEVFGSQPAKAGTENSDRLASSAEALLGIKYDITRQLAFHLGGGTELMHGRSSPDWRAYAGLNWSTGPEPTPREVVKPPAVAKGDPFSGPPKRKEKIVIHDILFEFDRYDKVLPGAQKTLKKLVAYLNKGPGFQRIEIEGHTDSIGPDAYNLSLSAKRARTIRNWLVQKYRLPATKVKFLGKGERHPIADNGNYQGRQLNRRVEFTIYRNM